MITTIPDPVYRDTFIFFSFEHNHCHFNYYFSSCLPSIMVCTYILPIGAKGQ